MTKEEIRHDTYKRMLDVENHYPDHIPRPVLEYYLLLSLIYMGNMDRFYEQHGWISLDADGVEEGKAECLRHGGLSPFERDVIATLNEESARRENARRPIVLAPSQGLRAHA